MSEREDEGGAMLPGRDENDADLPERLRAMYAAARVACHLSEDGSRPTEVWAIHATQERMLDLRRAAAALEYLSGEEEGLQQTVIKQGEILRKVVVAVKGQPPEGMGWSSHNADELVREELARLNGEASVLRALLLEASRVLDTLEDDEAGGELLRALKTQIGNALVATIHG